MKLRRALLLVLVALGHQPAHAITYYVAMTGSDTTGDGTIANPWRNPQKCFSTGTPLTAGDTCELGDGTYTTTTTGRVAVIGSSAPQGTINAPITIKSTNPLGATIEVPDVWPGLDCNVTGCPFTGIALTGRNYYIIEGIQFTRPGAFYATQAATAGISSFGSTGLTIRNNHFHDIGRTVCHNGTLGQTGIFADSPVGMVVENNKFNAIGRLRNGENGCTTTIFQHDHGIYIVGSTDLTIRRNVCYDVNRGFCINLKANGGVPKTLRAKIHHNLFAGASPTGEPKGTIALTNVLDDIDIRNNIMQNPSVGSALWWYTSSSTTGAGVTLTDNITNVSTTNDTFSNPYLRPAGVTSSGNIFSASLDFVDDGSGDYALSATSDAIDAGVSLAGYTYNGAADMGPFETFTASSASITNTIISVTFGMSLNTPVIPTSGATGWSIACSPSCGSLSIASVSLKTGTSSILDITVSGWSGGQCAGGQTMTISFDPIVGAVRDSATIAMMYQRLNAITTFPVTNNCTGIPPPSPPSGSYVYYQLEGNANDSSGGGRTGTASGGTYASSLFGQGYQCVTGVDCSVEAPYGNGVNPSTQSLTVAFSVFIPSSDTGLQRTYFGTSLGTSQRLHARTDSGTWRLAVQGYSGTIASDLAVQTGWNRVCIRMDSGTDTATLHVNGVAGTGDGAVRAYTSYALASNMRFGLPSGHSTVNAGQGLYDQALIWTSLVSCADDWTAWTSPPTPTSGTLAQVNYRLQLVYLDPVGGVIQYRPIDTAGDVGSPGAVALVMQINCTISTCTPTALNLRYSLDGVTFTQAVPDTPTADGVSFYGDTADLLANRFGAGAALSGALVHVEGPTIMTSQAVPLVSLSANNSMTLRYLLRFGAGLAGQPRYFQLYRQDGSALSSYAPTGGARVDLVNPRTSRGF